MDPTIPVVGVYHAAPEPYLELIREITSSDRWGDFGRFRAGAVASGERVLDAAQRAGHTPRLECDSEWPHERGTAVLC